MKKSINSRGYTWIELVITLALVGVVGAGIAVLVTIIHFVAKAW